MNLKHWRVFAGLIETRDGHFFVIILSDITVCDSD